MHRLNPGKGVDVQKLKCKNGVGIVLKDKGQQGRREGRG
jgi:hypothetical protein